MNQRALELVDVTFAYPKGRRVFAELDCSVSSGGMVAVTGPSGRGKSTLMALMGLLLRPTSGDVRIAGTSTRAMSDRALSRLRAQSIGFLFQDASLDPTRTILDNVCEPAIYRGLHPKTVAGEAARLLSEFGVADRGGVRPGEVSGGQAQRIALCRALLGRPDVVLADEPTGNLDREAADTVIEALRRHARSGRTVIIATHDPVVVASCDGEVAL